MLLMAVHAATVTVISIYRATFQASSTTVLHLQLRLAALQSASVAAALGIVQLGNVLHSDI